MENYFLILKILEEARRIVAAGGGDIPIAPEMKKKFKEVNDDYC